MGVKIKKRDFKLRKLSNLLKTEKDLIFYINKENKILDVVSPAKDKDCGNFKLEDLVPSYHISDFKKSLKRVLKSNLFERFKYEVVTDNQNRHYDMNIIPMSSKQAIITLKDITIQENSALHLEMIQKICEDTNDGVLVFSKDGNCIKTNKSLLKIIGVDEKKNPIKTIDGYKRFFNDETFDIIKSNLNETKKRCYIKRDDGSKVPIKLKINSIMNRDNQPAYRVCIITDISELEESKHIASYDELTGLPNRKMVIEYLEESIKYSQENKKIGAVCFLDLDNFKIVNDTMGHQAGDTILKECASRIKSITRDGDLFGRIGGDEFILVVRDINRVDYLLEMAKRIIKEVNRPFFVDGIEHNIGVSLGLSIFPQDSQDSKELLNFADMAMYKAKESGKNRYYFYSSGLDSSMKRKNFVKKILKYALKNDGFYLEFQPQFDISKNVVVGFESLLRIKSSIAKDISTKEFIKVAEESNLIFEVGRWSIKKAIQQLYLWKKFYDIKKVSVSINLSKRELIDEELPFFVERVLKQFEIDPSWIDFEVAESVILKSNSVIMKNIKRLKSLGCKISIDNFGTGTLPFNTFKDKMVDKIKIDKSVVEDLIRDKNGRNIVRASIMMANVLGLSVIAEGVEREEQKRVLSVLGCKEIQGYFFSRPLKADAVLPLVILDKDSEEEYCDSNQQTLASVS